jgi:hypothetical protein
MSREQNNSAPHVVTPSTAEQLVLHAYMAFNNGLRLGLPENPVIILGDKLSGKTVVDPKTDARRTKFKVQPGWFNLKSDDDDEAAATEIYLQMLLQKLPSESASNSGYLSRKMLQKFEQHGLTLPEVIDNDTAQPQHRFRLTGEPRRVYEQQIKGRLPRLPVLKDKREDDREGRMKYRCPQCHPYGSQQRRSPHTRKMVPCNYWRFTDSKQLKDDIRNGEHIHKCGRRFEPVIENEDL